MGERCVKGTKFSLSICPILVLVMCQFSYMQLARNSICLGQPRQDSAQKETFTFTMPWGYAFFNEFFYLFVSHYYSLLNMKNSVIQQAIYLLRKKTVHKLQFPVYDTRESTSVMALTFFCIANATIRQTASLCHTQFIAIHN